MSDETYPVLEVFVHGHWEPWCVFLQPTAENIKLAIDSATWKVKPLSFREGTTDDWFGLDACLRRMNRIFNHNLN